MGELGGTNHMHKGTESPRGTVSSRRDRQAALGDCARRQQPEMRLEEPLGSNWRPCRPKQWELNFRNGDNEAVEWPSELFSRKWATQYLSTLEMHMRTPLESFWTCWRRALTLTEFNPFLGMGPGPQEVLQSQSDCSAARAENQWRWQRTGTVVKLEQRRTRKSLEQLS